MSTVFNPQLIQDHELVVFWQDSFLPGYHEIIFCFPDFRSQAVRVVPISDPRAADLVS